MFLIDNLSCSEFTQIMGRSRSSFAKCHKIWAAFKLTQILGRCRDIWLSRPPHLCSCTCLSLLIQLSASLLLLSSPIMGRQRLTLLAVYQSWGGDLICDRFSLFGFFPTSNREKRLCMIWPMSDIIRLPFCLWHLIGPPCPITLNDLSTHVRRCMWCDQSCWHLYITYIIICLLI